MSDTDPVEIEVEIERISDTAVLVFDGARHLWLPRSQIREDLDGVRPGEWVTLTLPEWLAIKEGLV